MFYRRYNGVLIVLACVLLVVLSLAQTKADGKRSTVIPQVANGPVLKGDLSDPIWSKGAVLSGFTSLEKVKTPIQATTARVMYDSKNLYIGILCHEVNMSGLAMRSRGRDGSVWRDDGVEILVDTSNAENMYYHFFANAVGGYYETKCSGKTGDGGEWHGAFQVKSARRSDGWTAEFAIPFSELGITPAKGLVWGLNVCRNRVAGSQELSAWSPTPKGFGKPDRFGKILFGDKAGKWTGIKLLSWGDMGLDEIAASVNTVSCFLPNNQKKAVAYSATLDKTLNGKVVKRVVRKAIVKPGKSVVLDLPYTIVGSDGALWVLNVEANGKPVFISSNNVVSVAAEERVWQLKDPLYTELLSNTPPGDQKYGCIYWHHSYSPRVLPAFAKEYGIRYSNEEAIKEMADSRLLSICESPDFSDKYFLKTLEKYNVKLLFSPSVMEWTAPDAPKSGNASFMCDPRSREFYFKDLKNALDKWRKYIWGVYSGDEVTEQAMQQAVRLYADHKSDYPYIREVDSQVKEKFGAGKYGIPESIRDTNPYRWIALRKWMMNYLTDWQKEVYETVKSVDPEIRVISMDPPGGHKPIGFDRMAQYFDITTQQLYPPSDPNRQQFGFTTKMAVDLTGKPTWPCTHVENYAYSTTLDEVHELLSEVMRNGGKGFHFWLKDESGNIGDHGFLMATKWGFPARWRALCELNTLNATMNEVAIPTDPDAAIFYSEDHYSSFSEHYGMPNEPEWAYTFFGPVSRTWFNFFNDNMVNDGKADLSSFKAIIVPAAKYQRRKVAESILKYATDGGTLVIGDPEIFSYDVTGESLDNIRTTLVGTNVVAGKDQETMTFKADCSMSTLRNRTLAVTGKVFTIAPGAGGEVLAVFPDGSPAVVRNRVGQGSVILFAVNPFTQSATSDQAWKDFFKAFAKELGLKTDRDIWRFKFPPYKTVMQPEPTDTCLTGNYIKWWQDVPVYSHNAKIAGTYSYSVQPDGTADRGTTKIAFTSGKLTDRKKAYSTLKVKLKPEDFAVTWKTQKSTDVIFDLCNRMDLSRVNLWYAGQLPNVTVMGSIDGKTWKPLTSYPKQKYVKFDDVNSHEDVLDISLNLAGSANLRYVKLAFGERDRGCPFTLAECEVWGSTKN